MNKLGIIVVVSGLVVSSQCLAEKVPEYLVGGEISVTLKDGKVYKFNTEEYKVVRRVGDEKPKVEVKISDSEKHKPSQPSYNKSARFSAILHGGIGKDGLKTTTDGNLITVKEKDEVVLGLTVCTESESKINGCVTTFTNKTTTIGVKIDIE